MVNPAPAATDALPALAALLGPRGLLLGADAEPYCTDWTGRHRGRAAAVLRPCTTEAVAAAVAICAGRGVGIVPQGGNTGLVAGGVPDAGGGTVVLSLSRLNRVRAVDAADMSMVVEAGVTLRAAQDAAAAADCSLPLSISSEGTAQIGGILATNAGGNHTLRHGNARDLVLGLEAVLPDGRAWHGLRTLRKDNTGYCLRQLLVGSEGTLGIITAAALKLAPRPRQRALALCAAPSAEAALALLARFNRHDAAALHAFEYMCGASMALVIRHVSGAAPPLSASADHYVLVELASGREDAALRAGMEAVLGSALEEGLVLDAVLAETEAQHAALWKLREEHAEAQRKEGDSLKNDVSVPVARIPDLLRRGAAAVEAVLPGARPVPFGHLGDGNIHFNFMAPPGMARHAFEARGKEAARAVAETVRMLGGSFSAEHGIGGSKRELLAEWRDGVELDAMRSIKAALDPRGIMNPGKVL